MYSHSSENHLKFDTEKTGFEKAGRGIGVYTYMANTFLCQIFRLSAPVLLLTSSMSLECRYCGLTKPPEEFRSKNQCKECRNAHHRQYNRDNRDKIKANQKRWNKKNQPKIAEISARSHQKNKESISRRGKEYRKENKTRIRARIVQWRLDHPEEYRERCRVKGANRRAQLRNAGGRFSSADLSEIHTRQRGLCFYCETKLGAIFHIDHFIALSNGGSNDPSNLRLACPRCNVLKGASNPHEFIQTNFLRLF